MAGTPNGVLLCDPQYFDVVDVKNPFMSKGAAVDKNRAREQWNEMMRAFRAAGASVTIMDPIRGCEDMVFCANTALTGLDANGVKRAVVSRMTHASRQREIEPSAAALKKLGYEMHDLPGNVRFEGGGDAVWHAGHNRLFAGSGFRTEAPAYEFVEQIFGCQIVPLTLASSRFYHLDTCFCVIDEYTALVHRPGLTKESYDNVCAYFPNLIEVNEAEALRFACNACSVAGSVLIEQSALQTIEALRDRGFSVLPVDTSEFLKSGGSVYCMKQYLF